MNIRKIPLHEIKPYENNVKDHPIAQLEAITKSIKDYGFRQPIVIDKNNIIVAGHARYEAAAALGMAEVPCELADDLTDDQITQYRILDNEIAKQGTTNFDALEKELLKIPDFDFSQFNVEFPEVEKLAEGLCDEDETPELKIEATTKLGDVWILGNHRLMCGDSTNSLDVEKLTQNYKPILMVTDPPYGVNYEPQWRDQSNLGVGKRSLGKVQNDDIADWTDTYSLFTGDIAYIWHAPTFGPLIDKNLKSCDFDIISQIIWAKNNFAISRGDYHWKHEACLYAVKKGRKHNWQGARDQSTLWEISSTHQKDENEKVGHSTQKPVECMARPIINNSHPNDYVYDPFGGSGTTLIACEKLNRKCLMMELAPNYCDVIIKRWQKFSGQKAINESSGKTFDELSPLV